MIVTARVVHAADAVENNTYEQLREIGQRLQPAADGCQSGDL